jgi:hypothetical protein
MPKKKNGETFAFADERAPTQTQEPSPAQKLLDWLPRWPKDTITVRQIRVYGPYTIRDRRSAIEAAEVLVANGWLKATKPSRPDTYAWQITRKNIIRPSVAM